MRLLVGLSTILCLCIATPLVISSAPKATKASSRLIMVVFSHKRNENRDGSYPGETNKQSYKNSHYENHKTND